MVVEAEDLRGGGGFSLRGDARVAGGGRLCDKGVGRNEAVVEEESVFDRWIGRMVMTGFEAEALGHKVSY